MNRFQEKYLKTAIPALTSEFKYKNPHQVPRITKVVVSAGVGRAVADSKHLEAAGQTLATITGQRPVITKAKKSIASFKLREGMQIGSTVTLRGHRAQEFLDLLVAAVLPRIRDFRGLSPQAFDPHGNYSLGITDQTIFPQIGFDGTAPSHGLQVNIVTTAASAAEGKRLLELMGFPFRRTA